MQFDEQTAAAHFCNKQLCCSEVVWHLRKDFKCLFMCNLDKKDESSYWLTCAQVAILALSASSNINVVRNVNTPHSIICFPKSLCFQKWQCFTGGIIVPNVKIVIACKWRKKILVMYNS